MPEWREADTEVHPLWRRTFNQDWTGPDVAAPCPVCGNTGLHRWYLLENARPRKYDGIEFAGRGRLWEWCDSCRTFEHYPDGSVPSWWSAPYGPGIPDPGRTPEAIERARVAAHRRGVQGEPEESSRHAE
ncbi:hypothetical protein AAFN69_10150 [Streptomyces sp. CAU 1734]